MALVLEMRCFPWVCFAQVIKVVSVSQFEITRLFATVDVGLFLASRVGYYDLPGGVVLSVPLIFTDGKWSALSDVTIGVDLKERLQRSANEIRQFLKAKSNKDCSK